MVPNDVNPIRRDFLNIPSLGWQIGFNEVNNKFRKPGYIENKIRTLCEIVIVV